MVCYAWGSERGEGEGGCEVLGLDWYGVGDGDGDGVVDDVMKHFLFALVGADTDNLPSIFLFFVHWHFLVNLG